jgi:ATP-dependent Clp protease adapter protein ClpS
MHDICADTGSIQLFFHDDDDTPVEFVRELMRTVFGKSERDAITFTALFEGQDKVACGPYPAPVARALLESAQQLIRAAGHRLLITSEAATTKDGCDLCGALTSGTDILLAGKTACLCPACLLHQGAAADTVTGTPASSKMRASRHTPARLPYS